MPDDSEKEQDGQDDAYIEDPTEDITQDTTVPDEDQAARMPEDSQSGRDYAHNNIGDTGRTDEEDGTPASDTQPVTESKIPEAEIANVPRTSEEQKNQDLRREERRRKFKKHPMHYQKSQSQRLHEQQTRAPTHKTSAPVHHAVPDRAKAREEPSSPRKQTHQASRHTGVKGVIEDLYHNQYKKLLLIPLLILIIAISIIAHKVITTGDFVDKGVTLKGGITITISDSPNQVIDVNQLQQAFLQKFPQSDITVRDLSRGGVQNGVTIEASDVTSDAAESVIYATLAQVSKAQVSVEVTGPSLGAAFFQQTLIILLIALVCMAVVVFAYFRIPIPSMAIILAAVSSIITTLAVINLMHVKLSTAGVAAFLMLLGYSIDTDVVLSVRVLHRKEGTFFDRTLDAMTTGLTMTITALAATITALVLTRSDVIHQIMLILTIGLVCDMIYTWIQNAGILRWYLEKNGAKHHLSG